MKKLLTALLLSLCMALAFADDWYVVMGSFTKAENAKAYVTALDKAKIKTFQQDYTDKNGVHYIRVFYDEGFEKADTARMVRDSLATQKVVKDFKMTGLWICQTTRPAAEKPVQVQKPSSQPAPKAEMPVESAKPVPSSTPVSAPKTEEKKTPSPVQAPAPVVEPVVNEAPAPVPELPADEEIAEAPVPEKEPAEVQEKPVSAPVESSIPVEKTAPVPAANSDTETEGKALMAADVAEQNAVDAPVVSDSLFDQLPYMNGFELVSFNSYEIYNIKKYGLDTDYASAMIFNDLDAVSDLCATAVYKKGEVLVTVNVCQSNKGYAEFTGDQIFGEYTHSESSQVFADGTARGYICLEENNYYYAGFSSDRKFFYAIYAEDMVETDFVFISALFDRQKTIWDYECVKNIPSLFNNLTDQNYICIESAVDLESDTLVQPDTDWAILVDNCWRIRIDLAQNDEFYFVSAVDATTAKNAESVSDLFMTDKFLEGETPDSYKLDVGYSSAWYDNEGGDKSITFAKDSLFIKVNSYAPKEDLIEMADSL